MEVVLKAPDLTLTLPLMAPLLRQLPMVRVALPLKTGPHLTMQERLLLIRVRRVPPALLTATTPIPFPRLVVLIVRVVLRFTLLPRVKTNRGPLDPHPLSRLVAMAPVLLAD